MGWGAEKAVYRNGRLVLDFPLHIPDTVDTVMENGQPVQKTYSRFFVKRQVYKDGTWYDLKQCNKCGLMTL